MKKLNQIALIIVIGALSTATTWAQTFRWRIVNGPGAGVILQGTGNVITGSIFGAEDGRIAIGSFEDCKCEGHYGHYHGTLAGVEDNGKGCGWGCVDLLPSGSLSDARTTLEDTISTGTNAALTAKLNSLLDTADAAISNNCNSLFRGAMNAFGEELLGALENGALTLDDADVLVKALIDYVNFGYDEMDLFFPPTPPPPKPCKVNLLLRRGSGAQAKLFDARRKVNADVGEVVVLDAQGCPGDGPYEWEYKFKNEAKGDLPSGSGISFSQMRFCVISEKPTTVTVTVVFHCPDGKTVKDTATIVYQ